MLIQITNKWMATLPDGTTIGINYAMIDLCSEDIVKQFKEWPQDSLENYLAECVANGLDAIDYYML